MKPVARFLLLGLLPLFAACERELEYDVASPDPALVVNCIFAQDSLIQVEVSTTAGPGQNQQIQILKDAEVELYENDVRLTDIVLDSLNASSGFLGEGQGGRGGSVRFYYHRTSVSTGHSGRNYELRVSHPGFPDVFSTSVIPRSPRVDLLPGSAASGIPIGGNTHGRISLDLTDEDGRNYYGIEVWADLPGDEIGLRRISFYSNEEILLENHVASGTTTNGYYFFAASSGTFFSNKSFDARSERLDLLVPTSTLNDASEIQVRVLRLSPELYQFVTSYQRQLVNQGNPFAEPAQVYSNIQNGAGIFAGYSVRRISIR